MNKTKQIRLLLDRTAELAANASTLRMQGPPGTIAKARSFLKRIAPRKLKTQNYLQFGKQLNSYTCKLSKSFPKRNWGAARKVLNIFLRDVLYNHYLNQHFGFSMVEKWLELPLDGDVAKGLLNSPEGKNLPPWPKIKGLNQEVSDKYQAVAKIIAEQNKTAVVHLDLIFWRQTRPAKQMRTKKRRTL